MMTVSIGEQLAAVRDDRLRVLVIGAGLAGSALARLLRHQGLHPVVLERSSPSADAGYMLGLLPLVDPVLEQLDAVHEFHARSLAVNRYLIRGRRARPIREYELENVFGPRGGYRWIDRKSFLDVLTGANAPVTYRATVTALDQDSEHVRATLRIGSDDHGEPETVGSEFDVVVGADGMHSATRDLMLRPDRVDRFDTGVGGWVGWGDQMADPARVEEVWGAGFFIGSYPVPGRSCVFVGGMCSEMMQWGAKRFVAGIRTRLPSVPDLVGAALDVVANGTGYLWPMEDRRVATWSVGRVVLLGDAAVGFLPTAGIGAAMAVESAGVLAACLAGANRADASMHLARFERAQRPRSEAAQRNSRLLARLMFTRSKALATVRDLGTRFVSAGMATREIRRLLEDAGGPLTTLAAPPSIRPDNT